jgi:hypothetical protein
MNAEHRASRAFVNGGREGIPLQSQPEYSTLLLVNYLEPFTSGKAREFHVHAHTSPHTKPVQRMKRIKGKFMAHIHSAALD